MSTKGALIIEARDSILSRLACYYKISEEYELSAVKKNKSSGGADNSDIQIMCLGGLREKSQN